MSVGSGRAAEGERLPTVYLHVGAPKTGSSYLQSRMSANAALMADRGVYWPRPWTRQVRGAREVRALRRGESLSPGGVWSRIAREIHEWAGQAAVISMEWLIRCEAHQVRAALDVLAPARVILVVVERDLGRTTPAAWQEGTQNRWTWTWPEFVAAITDDEHPTQLHREFWGQHDLPQIFRRWGTALPMESMTLVTVPPAGSPREQLWQRFCTAIGLDDTDFVEPKRDNPSLGATSAQLMRRVNTRLPEANLPRTDYMRYGKHVLAKRVLAERRGVEESIAVDEDLRHWLAERSSVMRSDLSSMPIRVVGDLADLAVADESGRGRDPETVTAEEMLDAAVDALAGLIRWTAAHDNQPRAAVERGGGPSASKDDDSRAGRRWLRRQVGSMRSRLR